MQIPIEPYPIWQVYQGIALTVITAAALWTARTVFYVRDDVRDLKRLPDDVKQLTHRVDSLEDWRVALDAVAEVEREQHPGVDRRHRHRRLRDRVLEELKNDGRDDLSL